VTVKVLLKVGGIDQTFTVTAERSLASTSPAVATIVDRQFAANLPLNGRSFQSLISMAPGVVVTATAFDDQGQFSVNGQRADANYFTIDGASANFGVTGYVAMVQSAGGALPALSASGGTNSLVSPDAMQEFRIQTSSFAPEFGRMPGAQVNIVTRSGTNQLNGSAGVVFQSEDWNGNNAPGGTSNGFEIVQPDVSLGGPVLKDKAWFFGAYRYTNNSLEVSRTSVQVANLRALASLK